MSVDISEYKVGIVQSIEQCGNCRGSGKTLSSLKVQIVQGDGDECFVIVVTSANNVREQSRYVFKNYSFPINFSSTFCNDEKYNNTEYRLLF